jgi:hypothetical protein
VTKDGVTPGRIDELLAFLPAFERPGRTYVKAWAGGPGCFPYPVYEDDVLAFFHVAGKPRWMDYDYKPGHARQMLEDGDAIQTRSLADIRTMLTYCVRAERFGDGAWEHLLQTGRVQAILRRLAVLRDDPALGLGSGAGEQDNKAGARYSHGHR